MRDEHDQPYESEEAYFRDVLGLASWRTAYKRLAIGRMLTAIPEPERLLVRMAVAEVGLAKTTIIAPAIERSGAWQAWVELARRMPAVTLQLRVSEALQAAPRGRDLISPGERFRRSVLSAMPDIEAMEVVERFFEIGQQVVGTDHPVGIGHPHSLPPVVERDDVRARRHLGTGRPALTHHRGRPVRAGVLLRAPPGGTSPGRRRPRSRAA